MQLVWQVEGEFWQPGMAGCQQLLAQLPSCLQDDCVSGVPVCAAFWQLPAEPIQPLVTLCIAFQGSHQDTASLIAVASG